MGEMRAFRCLCTCTSRIYTYIQHFETMASCKLKGSLPLLWKRYRPPSVLPQSNNPFYLLSFLCCIKGHANIRMDAENLYSWQRPVYVIKSTTLLHKKGRGSMKTLTCDRSIVSIIKISTNNISRS